MTKRQKLAIKHTCRLPEETAHKRFIRLDPPMQSLLTFNSGFE
jgi:hypothetical protein